MSEKTVQLYAERFRRVFDYIDRHLDRPLSVDELSRLANFSRFHFQRQFSEYVGLSVTRYIQQMRLRRASYQLVFNEQRRIIDIEVKIYASSFAENDTDIPELHPKAVTRSNLS